ncbi:MAG: hypothetical protein N3E46_06460, partial [Gemmataceae bacterium]|nr:hypothetical protein [Gemmataceae bacterium]
MFWGRRVTRGIDPTRTIGVELNASIIRSACWGPEGLRQIPLQPPAEEMPLCVALHQRHLLYGQAAQAVARTMPHAICDNFLPSLGHSQQWRFGRHCLTAESALETILLLLRPVWESQAAPLAVAVPAYLSAGQVQGLARLFRRMGCTLRAVLLAPLGVAAAFAPALYSHLPSPTQNTSKTLVQTNQPARDLRQAPITVGIVDVDAFALSA